jgi:SAM-dependent methyltransferase
MTDERGAIVRDGYDAIAGRYLDWSRSIHRDPSGRFLSELAAMVPPGGRVLDLGCGAGIPSTAFLAERFEVVGVDVSAEQLRRARANVPGASFVQADMCDVELPTRTFDAACALYSVSHVPRERHAELFARIAAGLKPGGYFLASLGATGSCDWTGDWLGNRMFFSSHDAETNRGLLRDAGFSLVVDEIVSMREPEADVSFLWVIGRTSVQRRNPRRSLSPRLREAKP